MAFKTAVLFLVGLAYVQCYIVVPSGDPCNPTKAVKKAACMVVRPQSIPKPAPLTALLNSAPIPGPCGVAKEAIVKPAYLPPPTQPCVQQPGCAQTCANPCAQAQPQRTCLGQAVQAGEAANSVITYGGAISGSTYANVASNPALVGCQPIDYAKATAGCNQNLITPADPVSLALAMKRSHQRCITGEDKLAFGFTKLPVEIPLIVKEKLRMPEDNLYKLNGQIVELKAVKKVCQNKKSLAEEAMDDLEGSSEEIQVQDEEVSSTKQLSLQELGYQPAKIQAAPFINVPVANPIQAALQGAPGLIKGVIGALTHAKPCHDGFIPGKVEYKTIQKKPRGPLYVHPKDEDCESEEISLPAGSSFVYQAPQAPLLVSPPAPCSSLY
ncbi:unnamed protein product [Brassicogethes aeneus]|uniref:Uncharacterized protein n=1 Tax=Brassicogethes aeneus TaxID=1431903 RepID=A0A9P0FBR7_BRAAE|nr:unnamed protein product [Brassicogethes aeneus]